MIYEPCAVVWGHAGFFVHIMVWYSSPICWAYNNCAGKFNLGRININTGLQCVARYVKSQRLIPRAIYWKTNTILAN